MTARGPALLTGALVAGLLGLCGCAELTLPPRAGPPAAVSGSAASQERYREALDRFTRHAEIYELFDTRAFTAATLQTMAFRQARVARMADFRSQTAADVEALLAAERKAHEEALEVVVGLHANERRFDDMNKPNSIWSLALVSEAGEVAPLTVERISRPDPNFVALYPYLGAFWTAYRVRFPRNLASGAPLLPETARKATLRLSSSVGKVELAFALEPGASGAAWP